jgi:hypothetical protein
MALDDTRHARHGAAKKRNKFQPLEEEEEKKKHTKRRVPTPFPYH